MPSLKNMVVLALVAAVSAQVDQLPDGQPTVGTSAVAPVSQITDGQIQAVPSATVAPVSQITDGQIQAPTSVATVAPVSQITDGQIQAPTSVPATTVAPVTQIPDGQIQAPTAGTGAPVPTANGTFTTGAPAAPFTGGAALVTFSGAALGLAALAAML
ncbi:MAG: hypothetical protein Q9208_006187 [Pyrenodesmia sp. 3 TL-2023]